MGKYYDGNKLLNMKDLDGEKPEIYICDGNRTAGKTTFFNRKLVLDFLRDKYEFLLLYRYSYELDNAAETFFKDIGALFFGSYEMTQMSEARGQIKILLLNDEVCGYAVSLNNPNLIKRYSHYFHNVKQILFDEFQNENDRYCTNEVQKFISIHTSIARGNGEQVRYVPCYLISNSVNIINPYYCALGIDVRLDDKTKFLRGNGWVLEHCFNESASKAQQGSRFLQAFKDDNYTAFSSQNVYLNNNKAFVEKMEGYSYYVATIKFNGKYYAIREFRVRGIVYVDENVDNSFPLKIAVDNQEHEKNFLMLDRNEWFIQNMRSLFKKGCVRFKNFRCKEAFFHLVSY